MPTAPRKPCPNSTCKNLGDCPLHGRTAQRRRYDQARAYSERSVFYRSPEWKAIRLAVLNRDPDCRWGELPRDRRPAYTCGRPSTTAAHIVPWAEGGRDDPDNLRGLCTAHHSQETSRGESWNRRR